MQNKKIFPLIFSTVFCLFLFLSFNYASAAVSFVSCGTAIEDVNGDINVTSSQIPAGIQNNDILILIDHQRDNISSSAPADWTNILEGNGDTVNRLEIFWKRTTGSESGFTLTHSGGGNSLVNICAFRGAETAGSPFNVNGTVQSNAGSPISTASITTTVNGDMILHLFGSSDDNTWGTFTGIPVLQAFQYAFNGPGGNDSSAGIIYGVQAIAGSTGAAGATQATLGPDPGVSVQMSLKPALITTTTTLATSGSPAVYGNTVTFTATVTPASGGAPTGTVTFKDGAVTIGTGTLNGANPGVATYSTTTLSVVGSPHSIAATYNGDSSRSGSTSNAVSQTITAKALTVTGITANNKVYDGTTVATLNVGSAALVGVVAGDTVILNTGSAAGTFSDKNVGTGKTVQVSGLTISGASASNYTLTQPTTTANITAKALTVTGMTAANKVYDATTSVTLSGGTLVGVVGGDVVSINTRSGSFDTKTVGTAKSVTVTSVTLTGADAGNYTVTNPTGITADITAASLTVTGVTANNKVYDGTTVATLNVGSAALAGVLLSDSVTLNTGSAVGTFSDADVGTGKTVTVSGLTISGADSSNYSLIQPTTTANITAKNLTVTGITANNKEYDGNTTATLNVASAALVGVVGADDVTLNTAGATGTFDTPDIGVDKTVTISGLTLTGTKAGNYTLTQPTTTASITGKILTVTGMTASNKVYDATTAVTLSGGTLVGVVGGDDVSIATRSGTFIDKNVGISKTVNVTSVTLTGADAAKYSVTNPTGITANITARSLTVSATGDNKIYDATTSATVTLSDDRVFGDTLTTSYASASFADKHVGTGKTVSVSGISISGTDSGNYTANTSAVTTANITARSITVTAATNTKTYDGTTTAAATPTITSGALQGSDTANFTETYDTKAVGTGKTLTPSGSVTDGNSGLNYSVTFVNDTTGVITAKGLTVTGITAEDKVYDGNTTATVNTSTTTLVGIVGADVVTLNTASVTGTFDTPDPGADKTVTISGLTVSGVDAANYVLTQPTALASITSSSLTVTGITAASKIYDGTMSVTLSTTSAVLVGVAGGDDVTLDTSAIAGAFGTADAGTGKLVTISGLTLAGTKAGNYSLIQPTATTTIFAKNLTVTGITAEDKVYDGNTTAIINTATTTLVGVIGADDVTLNTAGVTGTFDTPDPGADKTVTISGLTLSGTKAGNYALTQPTTTATITSLPSGDTTAPSAITNLSLSNVTSSSISLTWTAPGDDGSTGTATSYDVRYLASTPVNDGNWSSATPVSGEPVPLVAGTSQSMTVSGLLDLTTYYFAMKTSDEVPNVSTLSNVASTTTLPLPVIPDTTAPADVTDLALSDAAENSIKLTWTAPGDDNNTGTTSFYDIRYSTSVITGGNWASATSVNGEPSPSIAGTSQSMTVIGLSSNTTYYFAMKSFDDVSNASGLSNVPSLSTLSPAAPPAGGPTPVQGRVPPTTVNFAGQAFPGGKVEVLRKSRIDEVYRNIPTETYTMSSDGKFTISLTALLQSEYYFALRASDKRNDQTDIVSFTANFLSQERLTAVNIFFPPTVRLASSVVRKGDNLLVSGYAAPRAGVDIYINDIISGKVPAGNDGFYSFSIPTASLDTRDYSIKSVQADSNGNQSGFSTVKSFRVSPFAAPKTDFNGDNLVDIQDLSVFMYRWRSGTEAEKKQIDLNNDGKIDLADFSLLLNELGGR